MFKKIAGIAVAAAVIIATATSCSLFFGADGKVNVTIKYSVSQADGFVSNLSGNYGTSYSGYHYYRDASGSPTQKQVTFEVTPFDGTKDYKWLLYWTTTAGYPYTTSFNTPSGYNQVTPGSYSDGSDAIEYAIDQYFTFNTFSTKLTADPGGFLTTGVDSNFDITLDYASHTATPTARGLANKAVVVSEDADQITQSVTNGAYTLTVTSKKVPVTNTDHLKPATN